MKVKVYVEGGGDHNKALQTQCRRGFSEFISKAGLEGRMPGIVACGGRRKAYESFKTALSQPEHCIEPVLLVDSEEAVQHADPWDHVMKRADDRWERPNGASADHLHLMVQAMEAWFYADKEALEAYYGYDLRPNALSRRRDIEVIPKAELIAGLRQATRQCRKGEYSKGEHSFQILAQIEPAKVRAASARADRLLTTLTRLATIE